MSELEERINSLLKNPEELSRLTDMARSIMEGGAFSGTEESGAHGAAAPDPMLQKLMSGLAGMGKPSSGEAMLHAISPYLEEKRGQKLERAIRMAQMLRAARTVMKEYGEDGYGNQ